MQAQTFEIRPVVPPPLPSLPSAPPTPLPPANELLPLPPATDIPSEELPTNIPGTITVERFLFVGSTVFSDEELAAVTQSFSQRPISFAELLQARSAVTKLYVDAGYVTSGAYIPPQAIEKGVVTIKIVEGSLEAINVEVKGKLHPNYIRDRIALATRQPLSIPRLLEALQLLQLDPLIAKISAQLAASTHPGKNILDVTVETAPSFRPQIIADNGRSPQVGSFRRGVKLAENNLLGYGDSLQGFYLNTDGSDDIDMSYEIPVNPRNGKVKLEYRTVSSKIIEPPFNILNIESNYQKYGLSLRQPVVQSPNQEFALGITFDRQESTTTYLNGLPFPAGGADDNGQTQVSTLRFFQEWLQRNDRIVIAARSEFNFGIDAFGTTTPFDAQIDPNTPSSQYFMWRGQAQWVNLLAPDMLLLARTEFQFADRPIVSLEQFALGGLGSVEGYRQNTLLTDNGFFASIELRLPIFRAPQQATLVQLIPFVDFGTGWNSAGSNNPDPNILASAGVGLQWQQGEHFSARIDWAIPLGRVPFEGNTWQDNGIVFSIIFSP